MFTDEEADQDAAEADADQDSDVVVTDEEAAQDAEAGDSDVVVTDEESALDDEAGSSDVVFSDEEAGTIEENIAADSEAIDSVGWVAGSIVDVIEGIIEGEPLVGITVALGAFSIESLLDLFQGEDPLP